MTGPDQGADGSQPTCGPLWQILVPTLSRRREKFMALMDVLLPQCEKAGCVSVLACSNDAEESIGSIRQRLLEATTGEYVSFVDDDDMVPGDFVEAIAPLLLDTPDIVAFRLEYTQGGGMYQRADGTPAFAPEFTKPCDLSVRHVPHDDPDCLYRDLTHVQPIRRELALLGDFRAGWPEDSAWRAAVRPHVCTEAYTDRVLYYYRHDPRDSVQYGARPLWRDPDTGITCEPQPRPVIHSPAFAYLPWPKRETESKPRAVTP